MFAHSKGGLPASVLRDNSGNGLTDDRGDRWERVRTSQRLSYFALNM